MMWRWMVLVLVIANGVFWLWSHSQLRELGWGPVDVSEPARLKSQIQPEAMQVTPQETNANPVAATEPAAGPTTAPAVAPSSAAEAPGTAASAVPAPTPAATAPALSDSARSAKPHHPAKGK